MATRKMNMFEKIANMVGVLYRHQQRQFPRRYELLTKVAKKELAPPNAADLPVIKRDWANLLKAIETRQYRNLTVKVCSLSFKYLYFFLGIPSLLCRWNGNLILVLRW